MEYDAALEHLGRCGRFQKITAIAMALVGIPAGFNMVAMTFLGAMTDHRCRLHENSRAGYAGNATEELNASIPWENVGGTWRLSQCNMYVDPLGDEAGENATIAPCEYGWVYDRSQYSSSIVTEFDLVCNKAWLTELAQSIYMSGVCVGAVLFGVMADRYGRRPILLLCLMLQIPLMFAVAFATNYVTFVTLRFFIGATTNGFLYSGIVIGTEVVHTSRRSLFGMSLSFTQATSYMLLGALAYFFRDWRNLQLAMSIPSLLFVSYWWLAPESPRWLLTNHKTEEAKAVIRKAAKQNGVEIPKKIYELIDEAGDKGSDRHDRGPRTYTMLDLVRTPKLRATTILISTNWFVLSGVYYGLWVGTSTLAGDHYVNFITSACVEGVGVFVAWFTMERCGRKRSSAVFMLIGGCACAATAAVPHTHDMISTVLAMVGRFGISVSFNVFYVYSAEVFPTVVRNMGLGVATMLARVGGIIAPFVYLLADTWRPLPLLTFGLVSIFSGLTMLTMPETLGKPLPNTIASVENVSKTPPPILVPDGVVLPDDIDNPLIIFQKLTVL
ncbi:organic cation transporter protein-like isoform X5 [Branchiostoma floridae x Branchiostoma belcheri]